jgi:hypothetical protein
MFVEQRKARLDFKIKIIVGLPKQLSIEFWKFFKIKNPKNAILILFQTFRSLNWEKTLGFCLKITQFGLFC